MIGESALAASFDLPYYAVIFSSVLREPAVGYEDMAEKMAQLAGCQPGFLGLESVRKDGVGITVSYWTSEEALRNWKLVTEHRAAQARGRAEWYLEYRIRIAKVEREYGFSSSP